MSNKTWNIVILSTKTLLVTLLIFTILIPALFGNFKPYSHLDFDDNNLYENGLNTNDFTKDNYSTILPSEKYGLGNVTADDLRFNFLDPGFFLENISYPLVTEDHNSGSLNMDVVSMNFINTTSPAIEDNLDKSIENTNVITVRINETLNVSYTNPIAGYLIYHSRYLQVSFIDFYVNNVTKLTLGEDYFIDNKHFIVFYYRNYFQKESFNFTMHLIWDLEIRLGDWRMAQQEDTSLIMREVEQDFTATFTYQFVLFTLRLIDLENEEIAPYIDVALTVNLPDKELLYDHEIVLNGKFLDAGDYLKSDKSLKFELSDEFATNQSYISLNFTSNFRLKFEEPVGKSWAIDRLVAMGNIREKIYFVSLISGPEHIYLKYISFIEPNIYFDDVISSDSLFNRDVAFFEANVSIPGQDGLRADIPWLILGETCPFSIKYFATQTLKIVITDNIKMPLIGAIVKVLYFNKTYGTYISNENVQPISPGKTDENGQIILYNVPYGNYTARIYWKGKIVKEVSITTSKENNYVFTNVTHFPLWILIFALTNGIILFIGALFYLKFKKSR